MEMGERWNFKSPAPHFLLAVFAKNFHVKAAMKSSVLLTWEIPDTYNPAQPFTVSTGEITFNMTHFLANIIRTHTNGPRSLADPLRQWAERGSGREAKAEANHGSPARDAVLIPPD